MVVTIQPRSERFLQRLKLTCESMFLEGHCYIFAIALHRGLGWPIVGLMQGETIRHALVQNPENEALLDVRGFVSGNEVGEPFGISPPYKFKGLQERDLFPQMQKYLPFLPRTTYMAEELFPDLLWKSSLQERARKFAEELDALSEKHGIWIRAIASPHAPLLVDRDMEEHTGYALERIDVEGGAFAINCA